MRAECFEEAVQRPRSPTFLPFFKPGIGKEEEAEVLGVLRSGWLTTGERVQCFEQELRKYLGVQEVFAVSSCTAALHLALDILNVQPGDEVVTTPFTFASTVNVILHRGATPVFVDISPDDLNLDVSQIPARLTPRTRVLLPVHFSGYPARMDDLLSMAKKQSLVVVEDAAHAFGAQYDGKAIGTFGHLTCFSFYVNKNLTTGEGGAIATNRKKWGEALRIRRNHGMSASAYEREGGPPGFGYDVLYPGYKYNLSDLHAAIGIHQLQRFSSFQARRKALASLYTRSFQTFPGISLPFRDLSRHQTSWYLYVILLNLEELTVDRDEFMRLLRDENVGSAVHYKPVHLFRFYRKALPYREGDFPVAESVYRRILSLPLYPMMTEEDAMNVVGAVARVIKRTLRRK